MSEWRNVPFSRMFSRVTRRNAEQNTNVLTASANYGLVNQQGFFNKIVASSNLSGYYLLYKGEFVYNKSYSAGYPMGAFKRLEFYDKGVVTPLYICFAPTTENECPEFYIQYFEAGMMDKEINSIAQEGARNHGLLNVSVEKFFETRLLCPPLPEQRRIADVLSAADEAIATSRAMVEKYTAIKAGLMRDLLDVEGIPKIQLGSTGDWYGGITPSMNNPHYWGEGHYWLSSGEIKSPQLIGSSKQVTALALMNTTLRLLPEKTIVIVMRSGILKNYLPVAELQTPMTINQDIKGIVLYDGIDSKYMLQALTYYGDKILRTCMKAGTTVQSIELKWLKSFEIPLPSHEEQLRIAEILTVADDRLKAEQVRLRKLEDIKLGLMDDLLTNKVSTDNL